MRTSHLSSVTVTLSLEQRFHQATCGQGALGALPDHVLEHAHCFMPMLLNGSKVRVVWRD